MMVDSSISIPLLHNKTNITLSVRRRETKGPCILFMHGLQSNKHLFDAVFERDFFKDLSLLAVDFVGFGDSSKPDDFSYDIAAQASVIAALLDMLSIAGCHIVGHSVGGMVGTILLDIIPVKILSLCNLEGNFCYEDCGASKDIAGDPHSAERYEKPYYLTACSIVEWSKSGKLREYWNRNTHPKIIIAGAQSTYASKPMADAEVSNAGHFMLRDNPEETYVHMERFLAAQLK